MNPDIQKMLRQRQRFLRAWPPIALLLTGLTLGFYVWAFLKQPILVNPLHVIRLIQENHLDTATQGLLSIMAPILFLTIGALILLLLVFVTAGLVNEGRLIRLLEKQ
ncbi:hypothetical protein A9404_07310 [Halothiobacillus diazotrophicus]|uniref:Uncharacterized protein n=1 Tax=Halothiobacillus diazotrophicus TaxID=1860122 RepID=A0A191ZH51_9GAMM|nr:hypothetical protein [Halothiobacillus diazotrophicus]ANJ67216.1 hypothetical protein A9404_07310 [Halothiobacillus diazotrophicus]